MNLRHKFRYYFTSLISFMPWSYWDMRKWRCSPYSSLFHGTFGMSLPWKAGSTHSNQRWLLFHVFVCSNIHTLESKAVSCEQSQGEFVRHKNCCIVTQCKNKKGHRRKEYGFIFHLTFNISVVHRDQITQSALHGHYVTLAPIVLTFCGKFDNIGTRHGKMHRNATPSLYTTVLRRFIRR